MPHDYFWQWHTWWIFPTFMPVFWLVIIGLCLSFIFGPRRRQITLGSRPGIRNRPGYPEKALSQRGISKEEFERVKQDILN
jgi:hypothetical protein